MKKKLYLVSVSFTFPALASSEEDAVSYTELAIEDGLIKATASQVHIDGPLPDCDLEADVYGSVGMSLKDVIDEEAKAREFASKQTKMPW